MSFYQPQRQSAIGIVVNFLYAVQKMARAFIPLIVLFILKQDTIKMGRNASIVLAILLIVLLISYLKYRFFTFHIDKETQSFVINKGFINKKRITIQLDKIQQVNIHQTFINKVVGIYAVEVDSAGSSDKEGVINSVSKEIAEELKHLLLTHQNSTSTTDQLNTENYQLPKQHSISILTLLKVGITSNYLYTIGILLFFANTILSEVSRMFKTELDDEAIDLFIERELTIVLGIAIVVSFFIVVFVVNIVRTVLKFYNYNVKVENQTLLLSHGLLTTRNTLIKPNRVQKIVIVQNYFQKLWNICSFKISQIADNTAIQKKAAMEIPGCSNEEKHTFFQLIFDKQLNTEGRVLKHNYRFFGFRFFMIVCIPIAVFSAFFKQSFAVSESVGILLAYLLIATALIYRLFRVGQLAVNKDFIVIRKGIWDVEYTIFEPHKIQNIVLSQLFWQRSANVGSIRIITAGGTMRFSTADYKQLQAFQNEWMYLVEKENKTWM